MLLNCGVGEDSWESLGLQGDPTSPSSRRLVLGVHWKDWCWSWNSNTLATWCEELTHWKRPWCWERLRAGGEEDDRGWDGWMASSTQWTWTWVNSGSWWWTGRPGVLRFTGSQRVGHDWATELNWEIQGTWDWSWKANRGQGCNRYIGFELQVISSENKWNPSQGLSHSFLLCPCVHLVVISQTLNVFFKWTHLAAFKTFTLTPCLVV